MEETQQYKIKVRKIKLNNRLKEMTRLGIEFVC